MFESKIIVDKDTDVKKVMGMVDGLLDSDEDNLTITYLSGKNGDVPAEGDAAIEAMQDDLDEEEEEEDDEEVLEMVGHLIFLSYLAFFLFPLTALCPSLYFSSSFS